MFQNSSRFFAFFLIPKPFPKGIPKPTVFGTVIQFANRGESKNVQRGFFFFFRFHASTFRLERSDVNAQLEATNHRITFRQHCYMNEVERN